MKTLFAVALIALAAPAVAQTTPTPAPAPAAPAPAAKFTLDTPVETIVADPAGKKVLDADLPGLTTNERYDQFKTFSLNMLAGFAPDKLTPERLAKTAADLAAIK